jgi:serine/threonine protein kinase
LELLARGGQSVVYKARDIEHGRTVAVKVLHGVLDDDARARFDRERRTMGSLSAHPGIVTVFSSGFTPNGSPYLVMELMEGGSLADAILRRWPMVWTDAFAIGAQIADALDTAHGAGVIHGDVKPENLLQSSYSETKLTDLGVSSLASTAQRVVPHGSA